MQKSELYYQVALSHLAEQDDRNRQLNRTASGLLGLAAALSGVAALIMSRPLILPSFIFLAGFAVAFFFTIGYALHVLWVRDWRRDPDLQKMSEFLPDYEDAAMVEWAGDQFRNAYTANEDIMHAKSDSLKWSMIAIVVQAIMLTLLALSIQF